MFSSSITFLGLIFGMYVSGPSKTSFIETFYVLLKNSMSNASCAIIKPPRSRFCKDFLKIFSSTVFTEIKRYI